MSGGRVFGDQRETARRRAALGAVAGAGPGLLLTTVSGASGVVLGVVGGAVFATAVDPNRDPVTHGTVGAAAGIPAWVLVELTVVPAATGDSVLWTPSRVRTALPALGVWLVAGALFGVSAAAVDTAARSRGVYDRSGSDSEDDPTRVVVAGGGFAGLYAARRLERLFGPDRSVELTLVSRDNATLFTPMLAEVAGGSVSPTHITTPLRTALRRTRVIEGAVTGVDTDARSLRIDAESGPRGLDRSPDDGQSTQPDRRLSYDHLILGLGSVPDDKGIDPERETVLDFKTLGDAIRIRNHVIGRFERAEETTDPRERAAMTTFVVVGGGFAGTELAGAINDFAHALSPYYPHVPRSEIEVRVVHSRGRILPELGDRLADYALGRMRERGVSFDLGVRVADVDSGQIRLSDGRTLRAETVVWTAGNRPHPLVASLEGSDEMPGAVAVDETLSVPGVDGVWAAGDCAAVRDAETGDLHPNTAQHAIRAGATAAENVHATVTGGDPDPFSYRSQGTLAVIGHQVAVAQVMGRRVSGRLAWLLWRAVYLGKLPGTAQKLRVAVDWIAGLFFPRDLVRTIETRSPRSRGEELSVGDSTVSPGDSGVSPDTTASGRSGGVASGSTPDPGTNAGNTGPSGGDS